jgi:hypothetical protein
MSGLNDLTIFLFFVTGWVAIIAGTIYLVRRLTTPRVAGRCCLQTPCSEKCAREIQAARDRLGVAYDQIVKEIGVIVTAGHHELEGGGGAADDLVTPDGTSGYRP